MNISINILSTDSDYRSFYSSRDSPTVTELGQPVYVEVSVPKHEHKDLKLLLEDCWATPTKNPYDPKRWKLLVKGWILVESAVYTVYLFLCFHHFKLHFVPDPDVLSVVIATEPLCCQLSPERSWSIPLFIRGFQSRCSHLWIPRHLNIW